MILSPFLRFSVSLIACCVLCVASGATYYVSTTGNDTTGDGSIGNPWANIRKGVLTMAAGDTLNVRGGTYLDDGFRIEEWDSGTSAAARTLVQSYSGEHAIYRPDNDTTHGFVLNGKSNIVINGLELDMINVQTTGIKLSGGSYGVIITNCTIRNTYNGHGVMISPNNDEVDDGEETGHLITHCTIVSNGWAATTGGPFHQIYVRTSSNIVENCYLQAMPSVLGESYGIHSYMTGGHGLIYRNNYMTNCYAGVALVGASCWDTAVYNNICVDGSYGIKIQWVSNVYVLNNTCVSNAANMNFVTVTNVWIENNIAIGGTVWSGGLAIFTSTNVTVQNNLVYDNKINPNSDVEFSNSNVTTNSNLFKVININGTKTTNSTVFDAKFVSAATGIFQLREGSSALGTARTQTLFPDDFANLTRQGDWDMGAHDYVGGPRTAGTFLSR